MAEKKTHKFLPSSWKQACRLRRTVNLWTLLFAFKEYKPYMFWMNMIDAFYQSLVCFFIPYFVSVAAASLISPSSTFLRLNSALVSSPGLRRLRCRPVYMGDPRHDNRCVHHSAALRGGDQNLGEKTQSRGKPHHGRE